MMRLFLTILLFTTQTFAATYYVKNAGGTGAGTSDATAWSYAKFNATAISAGDIVNFNRGDVFYGTFSARPGVSGNPITYQAYGTGNNPVISGFVNPTSWTNSSGNIYYALLTAPGGAGIQIVTVDGVMKPRGRYPNTGYLTYTSHSGNSSITGTSIGALPSTYVGGEVVVKKYRYIIDRHPITAQSGNTITYGNSTAYGNTNNYEPTDGNGYFIQNHLATLDQNGEWYYDAVNSRLYVYMAGGMVGHTIKAGNVDQLIPFNSSGYANFSNLNFEGANYAIWDNSSNNIAFLNCNITQCGIAVYGLNCNFLTFYNSSFTEIGSNGTFIEANGSNMSITNCPFRDIGVYPGLLASGDGKGCGFAANCSNLNVSNSTFRRIGFNGIHFEGDNVFVYQNWVDSCNSVIDDGGAIYTHTLPGETRVNRIIRSNIITNVIGAPEGAGANGDPGGEAAGIYLDGDANHVTVDSNTIINGPWMAIMVNANSYHTITNNTTFGYPLGGLLINQVATSGYGSVRGMTVSGNKFIAKNSTDLTLNINLMVVSDNPSSLGTFSNNVYARPVNDNQTISLQRNYPGGNGLNSYTVSAWKTASGMDAGSLPSAITTSSVSNLRFDYNPSLSSLPVSLSAQYKDVSGTLYTSSQTLNPYRGNVLVYYGPAVGGGNVKVTPAGMIKVSMTGKVIITQTAPQIP